MLNPPDETKQENENINTNTKTENEIIKTMDQDDIKFIRQLNNLSNELNNKTLNLDKIKRNIDDLQQFNSVQQYDYLNNLLHPEKCKGVKIPTPIPVPSCSFQLHNCVTLTTNSSGNLAFIFNPFFLANSDDFNTTVKVGDQDTNVQIDYLTSFLYCNNLRLDGSKTDISWETLNIGQCIPGVYDQFRLVSASLVVKYIGRLDIASGVIGGAIVFDETNIVSGKMQVGENTVYSSADVEKYGNFDLAMDSFYHQENLCLEGLRLLYFPLDNSYEEYTKLIGVSTSNIVTSSTGFTGKIYSTDSTRPTGFNQLVYVLGAPASSACFKVDIYCNFECLPNAKFMNYLPLTLSPKGTASPEDKRKANLVVQNKPITKLSETESKEIYGFMPSIWDKLKKKFSGNCPSLMKLMKSGIINAVPGLKGGLTLAGTMMGMQID